MDVARWRSIRVPVRVVRGRRDVFARADDGAVLAGLVADVSQFELAEAGHFAHVEAPDATVAALADVWAAIRSGQESEQRTDGRARA